MSGLLRWLNEGLRRGESRRLEREFPTALDPAVCERHSVIEVGGEIVAHALAAPRIAVMGARRLSIGVISMVFCEPGFRGRGYATRAIRAAEDGLHKNGAVLALLWSDLDALYESLGYARSGSEWFFAFSGETLRGRPLAKGLFVGAPAENEWAALEALYRDHPSRCERRRGELRRLAAAPNCELRVAREDGVAIAYSVCGRGDDFPSIVHEWAGPPSAVIATLRAQASARESLGVLCPPHLDEHARAFESLGGERLRNDFAWMKVLDPAEFERSANAPLPVYLWGFDSL